MTQLFGGAVGSASPVKDTTTKDFKADVIDASRDVPVIVDFWAPWCGPCKTLGPILEKVVKATNGAVRMVKLNIDQHPEYPTQLRIQSIPAVYAFKDGRPIDGFVGALPESQVKAFVQSLVGDTGPSALEEALEIAKQAMADGEPGKAENIYRQIIQREPQNIPALVGLGRCALAADDLEDAKRILARIPETAAKQPDVISLTTAIDLAELAGKSKGAVKQLEQRLALDPNDHEARLELANVLYAGGQRQEAIDHLLASFKADREWNEAAARKQLLKLFEAMGGSDPLTVQSRKRLSAIMFS